MKHEEWLCHGLLGHGGLKPECPLQLVGLFLNCCASSAMDRGGWQGLQGVHRQPTLLPLCTESEKPSHRHPTAILSSCLNAAAIPQAAGHSGDKGSIQLLLCLHLIKTKVLLTEILL